jgi:hypothetical protein
MNVGAGLGLAMAIVLLMMLVASIVVVVEQHRERRNWKRTILCSLSLSAIWGGLFTTLWWVS